MKATPLPGLYCLEHNSKFFVCIKDVQRLLFYTPLFFIFFCSGCAQMYTGFQSVGVQSCHKLAYPEQQDCLEQVNMSYEEYEEDREKSIQL